MYLIAYLFDALADLYFSIWRLHHSGADGFRFGFIRLLVRTYLRTYTKMKSLNCGNKKKIKPTVRTPYGLEDFSPPPPMLNASNSPTKWLRPRTLRSASK